jgi:hypothetical protein
MSTYICFTKLKHLIFKNEGSSSIILASDWTCHVFDGQLAQYNYLELLCNIIFFNVCDAAACTKRVASNRQQIDASSTMHDGCVYAPVLSTVVGTPRVRDSLSASE